MIIGSRGSRLALIQAESVASLLREARPDLQTRIRKIATEGDLNRQMKLDEAEGTGVFVRALEESLIRREIDMAVHSLKDMPVSLPMGLRLAGTTKRLDPRDALVARSALQKLAAGSVIGTSSVRRSSQLKRLRSDLRTVNIRGNVDTRLRKVHSGEVDGIIVAVAAMIRLGLADGITEYLPEDDFVPSPGQGALAIEVREDDARMAGLCEIVNDASTWDSISAEREFLRALGGGCSAPISCLATPGPDSMSVIGMVSNREGTLVMKDSLSGDSPDPAALGRSLAERMIKAGAADIIKG